MQRRILRENIIRTEIAFRGVVSKKDVLKKLEAHNASWSKSGIQSLSGFVSKMEDVVYSRSLGGYVFKDGTPRFVTGPVYAEILRLVAGIMGFSGHLEPAADLIGEDWLYRCPVGQLPLLERNLLIAHVCFRSREFVTFDYASKNGDGENRERRVRPEKIVAFDDRIYLEGGYYGQGIKKDGEMRSFDLSNVSNLKGGGKPVVRNSTSDIFGFSVVCGSPFGNDIPKSYPFSMSMWLFRHFTDRGVFIRPCFPWKLLSVLGETAKIEIPFFRVKDAVSFFLRWYPDVKFLTTGHNTEPIRLALELVGEIEKELYKSNSEVK